ncbi:hypothetical protein TESG_02662 [Trichophyton tonsurans CBS 112818]|uniref:Acyltransferase 3 domain-containing protein n=1 Tax=Trichophyton tonsurans (strain CBS 112818) TaxID=647933 RepID=F2RUV6_TRIT1|nr:hypothetical protein TESG_02662 [Trichophyton tonsurans CBS 112818]
MASKAGPLAKPFIDTRWADGLRGIAALFVVASHVTLCFARSVMPPSISTDGPRRLFQNPYLRLIGQGNAAVSVFLVLLGFVNSLKTIQLIRSGCHQDAPLYSVQGIKSVAWEMIAVWIVGENRYDQPQWALAHLFKGSFFIYMVLLATASATPAFRLIALSILYAWGWIAGDTIVRPNVFAGMILAELTYLPTPKKSKVTTVLPYLVVALGLYLCSFPDRFADQAQWSRQLEQLGRIIFPKNAAMGRAWPNIGAQLLCFAVMYSPQMRHFLSHKWLHWIGSLSFALYLLHGMLMPIRAAGDLTVACLLPVFFAILLFVCTLWNRFVEPYFGFATAGLESFAKSFCRNQWPFNSLNSMPNGEKSILPTTRRD